MQQTKSIDSDLSASVVDNLTMLRLMFSFQGRIGRGLFVLGIVILLGVVFVITLIAVQIGMTFRNVYTTNLLGVIYEILIGILVSLYIWVHLALSVKRCHDLNISGFFVALKLVPVLGLLFTLWLLFAPGTEGPNGYGKSAMRLPE